MTDMLDQVTTAETASELQIGDQVVAIANRVKVPPGTRGRIHGFSAARGCLIVDFDELGRVLIGRDGIAPDTDSAAPAGELIAGARRIDPPLAADSPARDEVATVPPAFDWFDPGTIPARRTVSPPPPPQQITQLATVARPATPAAIAPPAPRETPQPQRRGWSEERRARFRETMRQKREQQEHPNPPTNDVALVTTQAPVVLPPVRVAAPPTPPIVPRVAERDAQVLGVRIAIAAAATHDARTATLADLCRILGELETS